MASVCWTNSRPFVALCLFIGVLLPAFQTPRLLSRFLSELPCIGRSSRGVCLCGMEASCSPHCSTIYAPSSLSLSPPLPLPLSLFTQQPRYLPTLPDYIPCRTALFTRTSCILCTRSHLLPPAGRGSVCPLNPHPAARLHASCAATLTRVLFAVAGPKRTRASREAFVAARGTQV